MRCVVLFIPVITLRRRDEVHDLDLQEIVGTFVANLEKTKGKVEWWDMTGNDPRLTQQIYYQGQKVDVRSGLMKFGDVERQEAKPEKVISRTFSNNRGRSKVSFKLQERTVVKNSNSWTTVLGILTETTQSTEVKVPFVTVKHEVNTGMELKSGTKETEVSVTQRTVKEKFSVKPKTELQVNWIVEHIVQIRNWTVDVTISGYFAVYYATPVEGKHLHFYPISQVKHSMLEVISASQVKFVSRGIYEGENDDSYLSVTERKVAKHTFATG